MATHFKGPVHSVGGFYKNGVEITGTGGSASTWDSLYDTDTGLTIDGSTLSFSLTNATSDGITLSGSAATTGDLLQFTNAGTGKDINGTSSTWYVTSAGAATFVSVSTPTLTLGSGSAAGTVASNGNYDLILTSGNATSSIMTITDGANGNITFTMNGTGGVVIAGTTETNPSLTVTNGDVSIADGSLTIVDDDNANSISLTNNTITTGNLIGITSTSITSGHGMLITVNGLTTGFMLKGVTTASGLTTGGFISFDDGSERFAVKADGATSITTGVNSTVGLTVSGIQTAENLAVFSTSSVTASGKGVLVVTGSGANAAGSARLLVSDTGTPAATTSYLAHFDRTGATLTNNPIGVQISNLTSTGAALQITSTATTITGGILKIVNAQMTTGVGIDMSGMTAITTGKAINVVATTTLTSGILVNVEAAGTALTGAGRFLYVNHTGAATAATSAKIVEFASAAADDTEIFKVTASAALAAGMAVNISAAAMTTGTALNFVSLDALTTGKAMVIASNSADASARNLVSITNTHASAIGAVPLLVTQSSTGATTAAISVANAGTGVGVLITGTGALGADKAQLHIISNVASANADSSLVRVHQDKTDGVSFCMTLVQDDLDVPFINFEGTATADANSNISTLGTGTVTDFVRCAINGTTAWIPVVTGALSS